MGYVLAGAFIGAVFLMVGRWSEARRVNTMLSAHTSTYATARGQRATITLPDGSTVLLNVASRLQVPADYAAGHRTMQLTGEALFTVAHHSGGAFTVVAGPSTTHVLGTSFVVRHYASDTAAVVAVRDGKVAVGATTRHSAVVTASEQIAVGSRGLGPVRPADVAVSSFVNGVLTLTGVSLPDAIPELNRWYDADIRLGDPQLATKGVTSEFAAGSLADLTELLEGIFNVRVVRVGRVLTLYAR
jgi:transmembrane sensor